MIKHESEIPRPLFEEHIRLREVFEGIWFELKAGVGTPSTIEPLVQELVQNVLDHFEHEEHGGYFSGALEIAPRLSPRVNELLSQHIEMAAQLVALQECAEHGDGSEDWSKQLSERFTVFFERFRAHEAAENRLLQEAYCDDIGAED